MPITSASWEDHDQKGIKFARHHLIKRKLDVVAHTCYPSNGGSIKEEDVVQGILGKKQGVCLEPSRCEALRSKYTTDNKRKS